MKSRLDFIEDIFVSDMLYALTIRSPLARGVLRDLQCPKLPNAYHFITAAHIPGKNSLADFPVPVLADKELSYIGEPLAILCGPDESTLRELASSVKIIAEEKPPVFSSPSSPDLIAVKREIVSPGAEAAFTGTGRQISGTYLTGIQEHFYSEPAGAFASFSPPLSAKSASGKASKKNERPLPGAEDAGDEAKEETLTVYTATQWPSHVMRSVAALLDWDKKRISLVPLYLGVHLDGKLWYPSLVSCHAALAAWLTKSPVKLMLTREEDFLYSPKRNRTEIKIRSAVGDKGEIKSSEVRITLDLGAQGIFEDEIMDHTVLGSLGLYNHRLYKISGSGVLTNIPPHGPLAGFGLSQGFFAVERHISRIADSLGKDPAEWRKDNFLEKAQTLAIGTTLKDSMPLPELIDAAAVMSDYYRKWASYELLRNRRREIKWEFRGDPLRGIGIATACQGSGFLYNNESGNGNCAVEMTLEKDGSLEIKTSLVSSEPDYLATWRSMVQEILDVDPALIRLTNNPGEVPDSGPGTLSRNIGVLTKQMERCCQAIRKQRFRSPLPITVKRSAKPGSEPGWAGKNIDREAFSRPSWGAAVAEIEIDPVSLLPLVRGIWLAVDGGKILSQGRARRTLTTGIIQALGWTCREQVHYEEGKIPPELFRGYDLPSPAEIPPISVDFIWNDNADPKGIGDLPFCCVPAAYVQAVSQAMDHPFEKIPLDARDILDAGELKKAGETV